MPTKGGSYRKGSYKGKRRPFAKRTRKNTILAKAKKAKTSRRNAKIVKRYKAAKLIRQPTLGLPDSQVVRMRFVHTIKHPGFAGEDIAGGGNPNGIYHAQLYSFVDSV